MITCVDADSGAGDTYANHIGIVDVSGRTCRQTIGPQTSRYIVARQAGSGLETSCRNENRGSVIACYACALAAVDSLESDCSVVFVNQFGKLFRYRTT